MTPTCRHCCAALHYSITSRAFRCLTPNCPMLDVAVEPPGECPQWIHGAAGELLDRLGDFVREHSDAFVRIEIAEVIDRHRRQGGA